MLVRHGSTSATRAGAFPTDEPLDENGRSGALGLVGRLPSAAEFLTSPALRCRETAEGAGLAPRIEPALAECDFGRWAGCSLADVHEDDPAAVARWIGDPAASPHGGEALTDFAVRVRDWLDDQARRDGTAVAITHGGVIKLALVHSLGAPLSSFWRVDVSPLSLSEIHAHDGRWTVVRTNVALAGTHDDGRSRP